MKKGRRAMQQTAQAAERQVSERERAGYGVSTVERLRRTGAPIDLGETATAGVTVQRVMDWPLRQLYIRGSLGKPDEAKSRYEAGQRFYTHWYESGLAGSLHGVDLNSPGGVAASSGMPIPASEVAYRHRQHFRAAQAALGADAASTVLALVVINEVPLYEAAAPYMIPGDRAMARGGAVMLLCMALDRLVAHFEG